MPPDAQALPGKRKTSASHSVDTTMQAQVIQSAPTQCAVLLVVWVIPLIPKQGKGTPTRHDRSTIPGGRHSSVRQQDNHEHMSSLLLGAPSSLVYDTRTESSQLGSRAVQGCRFPIFLFGGDLTRKTVIVSNPGCLMLIQVEK